MKKSFYILLAISVVVSLVVVIRPKRAVVDHVEMKRDRFEETLAAEGKIRARERRTVYAFANGNLRASRVKVGDVVTKGQVVTTLDWDHEVPVKSPIGGVITKFYRDSAGPVSRGEPVFEVSDVSNLEVSVELLTPDAIRIRPSMEAKIQNWGGEGDLSGVVSRISRAGVVKVSALGVEEERAEITVRFRPVPSNLIDRLGDNYHVDVLFKISEERDVLAVPLGALFRSEDSWAVFVVGGGRAVVRKISISKRNDRSAMVTDGLSEGERVILFPGDKIREGARVAIP